MSICHLPFECIGLLGKADLPPDRCQSAPEPDLISGSGCLSVGKFMEEALGKVKMRLNMEMEKGVCVFFLDERKLSK